MALAPVFGLRGNAPGAVGVLVPIGRANPAAGPNAGWTTYDHTPTGAALFVVDAPLSYPRVMLPANAVGITLNDLHQNYGVNPDGSPWSGNSGGITVYNNDPTSPSFFPDPSIEGYSVAYWIMNGAPVATAQTYAARWAAAVNRSVLKLSDLGPIGPGDPLYQKLQAQNALNLVTVATQPTPATGNVVDTTYTTAPGATLPVNFPPSSGSPVSETQAPVVQTPGTAADGTPAIASVAQSTSTNPPATAGFGGIAALLLGGGLLFAMTRKKRP